MMGAEIQRTFPASLVQVGKGSDPPASGDVGVVNRTGLVANIADTVIADAPRPGIYWLEGELEVTVAGSGTLSLNVTHTDDVGSITEIYASTAMAIGRVQINSTAYIASGNYVWNITGYVSGTYVLRMRCFYVG